MNTFLAPLVDRRTYRNLLYLALGLPLGTFYFTFISTATSTGVSLVIIWVGIPILAATVIAWRALARFERRLTERLLGTPIPSPPSPVVDGMNRWERSRVTLADIHTWRYLAWLLLRFPLGIFGFVLAVVATTVPLSLIVSPVALLFPDEWIEPSWLNSVDWLVWVVPLFGVGLAAAFAWAVNAFGELNAVWAKALLGPSPRQEQIVLRRRAEVAEERIRLAHELHDSVGHTLTMNVVQAGAGGHVFELLLMHFPDAVQQRRAAACQFDEFLAAIERIGPPANQLRHFQPPHHDGDVGKRDIQFTAQPPL